jgi:REP element-mobilizing transposase RayT
MPQSLANVAVHLVFSTKHRAPWLDEGVSSELYPYLVKTLDSLGCAAIQIGGVEDHVHLLFQLSRTATIAQVVEKTKTGTSKWVKGRWAHRPDFAWQSGYGIFSVEMDAVPNVKRYILNQPEHHRKVSFQDEFRALLEQHSIAYDERYVWD